MGDNYPLGVPRQPPATHCVVDNMQLYHIYFNHHILIYYRIYRNYNSRQNISYL